MKKCIFIAVLILLATLIWVPMSAGAWSGTGDGTQASPWQIGKPSNDNVTAVYDDASKTLTISGTGEMMDFDSSTGAVTIHGPNIK